MHVSIDGSRNRHKSLQIAFGMGDRSAAFAAGMETPLRRLIARAADAMPPTMSGNIRSLLWMRFMF